MSKAEENLKKMAGALKAAGRTCCSLEDKPRSDGSITVYVVRKEIYEL